MAAASIQAGCNRGAAPQLPIGDTERSVFPVLAPGVPMPDPAEVSGGLPEPPVTLRAGGATRSAARHEHGSLCLCLDAGGRLRLARPSDRGVACVVQRWAKRAGLDPARFAEESWRRGKLAAACRGSPLLRPPRAMADERVTASPGLCLAQPAHYDAFRTGRRGMTSAAYA
jgi:hypothetical protein